MVECGGLENRCPFDADRGFESLPLRQSAKKRPCLGPFFGRPGEWRFDENPSVRLEPRSGERTRRRRSRRAAPKGVSRRRRRIIPPSPPLPICKYLFIHTFSYYLEIFPTLFLTDNQTPRETKRDSYVRSHRFGDSWERRRFDRPDTGRRQHRVAPSPHGAVGPKPVFPVAVAVARRWCRGPLRRRSLRESRAGSVFCGALYLFGAAILWLADEAFPVTIARSAASNPAPTD